MRWQKPAVTPGLEQTGDFTERSGYEATQRTLALSPRPTAIFAANDSMAIGALRALREAGLRVPDAMSVAGFDDIPVSRYMSPALSSVHVAINEMGRRAIELGSGTQTTPLNPSPCPPGWSSASPAGRRARCFVSLPPERSQPEALPEASFIPQTYRFSL